MKILYYDILVLVIKKIIKYTYSYIYKNCTYTIYIYKYDAHACIIKNTWEDKNNLCVILFDLAKIYPDQ